MLLFFSFLVLPIVCIAQVIPTAPGPGETFIEGTECSIKWKPDATGTWDSFDIDLMSGSNNNMSLVTNVVSELDGTSSSSYSWTCPNVHPYSAIYFYQFNQKNASTNASHTWTTRFTIASEDGATASPEHSRQPNGDPIPWGIGKLAVADVEQTHSAPHTATARLPSHTPVTAEKVPLITRHVRTSGAETVIPPEVTLDVPPAKPTLNSRRNVFKTIYGSGTHADPCRATNLASAAYRTRFRNRPPRT